MRGYRLVCILFLWGCVVQTVRAQADQTDDDRDPKLWGNFLATGSFGLTAQFVDVNGSREKYRTDYNYLPGLNLSQFSLHLNAEDEGVSWLDYLRLNGDGFGDATPFERADLVFGKRGAYEFRGRYWKQNYFFNLPTYTLGLHTGDSARRTTDLSLRLFPHRRLVVELGYIRNRSYGTSFTSVNKFQNLVQLLSPKRALIQDFRIGASMDLGPLQASVFQNFRKFKEDPDEVENGVLGPAILPDLGASLPARLSVPSTQVTARLAPSPRWSVEGKYLFSDGHVEAGRSELSMLSLTEGITLEELIRSTSITDRPEHLGQIEGSVNLTENVVFNNVFSVRSFDITGQWDQQMALSSGSGSMDLPQEASSYINYRTFRNRPELEIFFSRKVSVYGGYQYEDRLVEKRFTQEPFQTRDQSRQTTITNSGFGGVTVRPYTGSRVSFEFEGGSADDAFHRIEPRDFTRWRLISRFPLAEGLSIAPHFVISDHSNETLGSRFDSDQRQGGVDVSYQDPGGRIGLTAGYTLFDLDTDADLRFFTGGEPVDGKSLYSTHLHFFHSRAEIPVGSRIRIRLGYQLLKDPEGNSFPLDRQTGEAGFRVKIPCGWSVDVGWYHVSYNERFEASQDYMANRLAVTLGWGF